MQQAEKNETVGLIDYLQVIIKYKKMIFLITTTAFVATVVYSLVSTKIYSSTAKILPPQQDQGLMAAFMGSMGGGMGSLAGDLLGAGKPADLYVSILNSESIKEPLIERFKLMDAYNVGYRLDAYKMIDKNAKIESGKKDGIISITVEDKDPKRAAEIANAFVEELGKLTVKLNISGAAQNMTFLGERLAKAKTDLTRAEESLKIFQEKNKALDLSEQAKGTIKGVAELMGQLATQEVQLATLRRQFTDTTRDVKNQKSTIENLKVQIARLEGSGSGGALPSIGTVPGLGKDYVRLMREFKVQEAIVELLTKQYEMTKLTQAKDITNIQIIQKARIPDKRIKPKRGKMVMISTTIAFFLSVLLAFTLDYIDMMPETERDRWKGLRKKIIS